MGKLCAFACILSIVILHPEISFNILAQTGRYDFLELVLRWPPSYCNMRRVTCTVVPHRFVISSFNPMYYPHIVVRPYNLTGCEMDSEPKKKLLKHHISRLIDEMETFWPSLDRDIPNDELWEEDWLWHGRCFNAPNAPRLYFDTGLYFEKRTNILDILSEGGISPTGEQYSISRIKSVIEESLGVEVRVICSASVDGVFQFLEVGICFARNRQRQACHPLALTEYTCGEAPGGMVTFDMTNDR